MKSTRRLIGTAFLSFVFLAFAVPAMAGPAAQQSAPPGAVFGLAGTPHLWIADDQGVLHWGGDTRALAGRAVNWGDRRDVTLDQLRSFRRGDPWLSAGLLKMGDPIYQAKWETTQERPTLLHIQSISDVEIFGIDASNYGRFVLDQVAWEQRYGFPVSSLARGVLQPAVPPTATPTPAVAATPTPSPLKARELEWSHNSAEQYPIENSFEITGAAPRSRIYYVEQADVWVCSPACTETAKETSGRLEAGLTDAAGRLVWRVRHRYFKSYTYTFEDSMGNKASVSLGDDRARAGLTSP
ncbi:MAG: hypothetical protein ACR2NO_00960 [Chloroflexota bacterium]